MDENLIIIHKTVTSAQAAAVIAEGDFLRQLHRHGLDVLPEYRVKWWWRAYTSAAK